jgi:hypothetical protein
MGAPSFRKIIQPKLKPMEPLSPYGTFHSILKMALEEWFNLISPMQIGTVNGTVTAPNGATTPFTYTGLKLNVLRIYFSEKQIMSCGAVNGELFFPNLFNYIGNVIKQQFISWSTNPVDTTGVTAMNPIMIYGFTNPENSFITKHFLNYSLDYRDTLSCKDPLDDDLFDFVWDKFEDYMKGAINTIPPLTISPMTGIVPGGVFNGIGTIKLEV